jgi:hypothetical protein
MSGTALLPSVQSQDRTLPEPSKTPCRLKDGLPHTIICPTFELALDILCQLPKCCWSRSPRRAVSHAYHWR